MWRKIFKSDNQALILAFLTLFCVFVFRFFLRADFVQGDFFKMFIFYLGTFFLLPYGIIRFFFNQKLKNFFFQKISWREVRDKKIEGFVLLFWIGLFLLVMLFFNKWHLFPVSPWILGRWDLIVFLELIFLPVILFFQEFFYRGFLLKIFSEKLGGWWAIIFQSGFAVSFEFLFLDRTFLISIGLFFFNCFLGWLVLRNKNFLFSWLVVVFVALMFDLTVKYKVYLLLKGLN